MGLILIGKATDKLLYESLLFSAENITKKGVFRLLVRRQVLDGYVGGCIIELLVAVTLGVKLRA